MTLTGIPAWLVREYLGDAGGRRAADGVIEGTVVGTVNGSAWRATLEDAPDRVVGSLRVGRVRLRITGDDAAVAAVWRSLEPRLLRAGG